MKISNELADRLMRLVVASDYRPSKPKQIATKLKLDIEETRELKRVIKQLVFEGRLIYGSNHLVFCLLYTSPSPRDGLLSRMPSSA